MMHLPASSVIFSFLAARIFASPAIYHPLEHRQASPSSSLPGNPGVVSTITSSNGTDLTSRFQTLVYFPEDNVVASNLTDRDLSGRQLPGSPRPINTCRTRGAEFRSSACAYLANYPGTMRRYIVKCDVLTLGQWLVVSRTITELVGDKILSL